MEDSMPDSIRELVGSNSFFPWLGTIDEGHCNDAIAALANLLSEIKEGSIKVSDDPEAPDAVLYLSIAEGDLGLAWTFFDFVRMANLNLTTIASGDIALPAMMLLLSGKKRYVSQYSRFSFGGLYAGVDNEAEAKCLGALMDMMGLDDEEVHSLAMAGEEVVPSYAKELGIVHYII